MKKVPLYPLEMILFPGEEERLYVFEKRYLQLIRECEETEKPFGLLSVRENKAPLLDRSIYGTMASVYKISKRHFNGNIQVDIVGKQVFKLRDVYPQSKTKPKPYLMGKVQVLKEKKSDPKKIESLKVLLSKEFKEIRFLFESELGEESPLGEDLFYYDMINFMGMGFGSKKEMLAMSQEEKKLAYLIRYCKRVLPYLKTVIGD